MTRTTRVGALLVFTACAACGGGGDDDDDTPAEVSVVECLRAGETYRVQSEEIDGDCGAVPDQIVNISERQTQSTAPVEGWDCEAGPADRTDECTNYFDRTCHTPEDADVRQTGKLSFKADGSGGSGTMMVTLKHGGSFICASSYHVTYSLLE
jgi:hypothetical protein